MGGPNTLDVEPARFSVILETQWGAPRARGPATSTPGLHRLAPLRAWVILTEP